MLTDTERCHDLQVPSVARFVPLARHAVRNVLREWEAAPEFIDVALLVVSELVTNVVRHAAVRSPEASISLRTEKGVLVLAVSDTHPYVPVPLQAAAPHRQEGDGSLGLGLGLRIVQNLANGCGGSLHMVRDQDTGVKTITARLPMTDALGEHSTCVARGHAGGVQQR
ncbi:ATP-binding protein [Streptomyces botrytidirepellens]|nr:ATP-binding protein [Streptomyces botrytidirepellens]